MFKRETICVCLLFSMCPGVCTLWITVDFIWWKGNEKDRIKMYKTTMHTVIDSMHTALHWNFGLISLFFGLHRFRIVFVNLFDSFVLNEKNKRRLKRKRNLLRSFTVWGSCAQAHAVKLHEYLTHFPYRIATFLKKFPSLLRTAYNIHTLYGMHTVAK